VRNGPQKEALPREKEMLIMTAILTLVSFENFQAGRQAATT